MSEDTQLGLVLIGIVLYKAVELAVVRKKIEQAFIRGTPFAARTSAKGVVEWSRRVEWLRDEFYMIPLVYLISIVLIVGEFIIIARGDGGDHYLSAKALAVVTIVTSLLISTLNLIVEHFRTLMDQNP